MFEGRFVCHDYGTHDDAERYVFGGVKCPFWEGSDTDTYQPTGNGLWKKVRACPLWQ